LLGPSSKGDCRETAQFRASQQSLKKKKKGGVKRRLYLKLEGGKRGLEHSEEESKGIPFWDQLSVGSLRWRVVRKGGERT